MLLKRHGGSIDPPRLGEHHDDLSGLTDDPTPKQIRAARAELGLTQTDFGAALGLRGKHRKKQVHNWEYGHSRMPGASAMILRARLLKHREMAALRAMLDPPPPEQGDLGR